MGMRLVIYLCPFALIILVTSLDTEGNIGGGGAGQKEEARVNLSKYKPVESCIVSWRVLGMSTLQSMLHTTVSTEFNFFLTFTSLLVFSSHHHGNNIFLLNTSLIPRPLPPQGEAWYTLLAHA